MNSIMYYSALTMPLKTLNKLDIIILCMTLDMDFIGPKRFRIYFRRSNLLCMLAQPSASNFFFYFMYNLLLFFSWHAPSVKSPNSQIFSRVRVVSYVCIGPQLQLNLFSYC